MRHNVNERHVTAVIRTSQPRVFPPAHHRGGIYLASGYNHIGILSQLGPVDIQQSSAAAQSSVSEY